MECLVERGFARIASNEEMLMALDRAEEAGLVHVTGNTMENAGMLCNCCGCCCGILSTINKCNMPGMVANTNYIISYLDDSCIGCGNCTERCQFKALTLESGEKKLLVDHHKCVGCGVCIRGCDQNALSLAHRSNDDISEPYKTKVEMGMALFQAINKANEEKRGF